MRVLLLGMGSRGDVQPFIALGERLVERGYAVSLAAAPDFRELVAGHGIEFEPFSFELEEGVNSELGREWLGGSSTNQIREARLMRRVVAWTAERLAADLRRLIAGADAVVSSALTFDAADSLTAETQVLHASVLFQPMWPSRHGPSSAFALRPRAHSWLNLAWSLLAGRAAFDIVRPAGDLLRRELGVRPRSFTGYAGALRRTPTLLAVSPAVVPSAPDWPPGLQQTGFWFGSAEATGPPDRSLERFVDEGPPPVYLGLGSMPTADPGFVVRTFAEVLRRRGGRGVVGAGLAGLGRHPAADAPPGSILVVENPSHEWLFPRCATVVHHGGAGTTAAAFRAGVPQVVVPHIADQPYWARRVHELGCGPKPLPRKRFDVARLGRALDEAMAPSARSAAYGLGVRVRVQDGAGHAAVLLDGLLRRGLGPVSVGA